MSRKGHTIQFEPAAKEDGTTPEHPRYLQVNGVSALYIFGSVDDNSAIITSLENSTYRCIFSITMNITPVRSVLVNTCWQDRCSSLKRMLIARKSTASRLPGRWWKGLLSTC